MNRQPARSPTDARSAAHFRPLSRGPISRRLLLKAGAGVVAGLVAGGLALPPAVPGVRGSVAAEAFFEPEVRSSSEGLLDTSLDAAVVSHPMGGRDAITSVYDGVFPGPTLRIHPGDRLRIKLSNHLAEGTNLHVHGLHVSPSGNSDNVLLHIEPDQGFQYEYQLPADHPSGMYWYHPHMHGNVTEQVFGGMAGVIIVEGDLDNLPGIAGLTERLLILHATQLDDDGRVTTFFSRSQNKYLRTVNGQLNPTFTIRPGETQRLRIGNFSAGTWFRLKLDGHTFYQIAKDGNTLNQVWARDEITLVPAERAEVLIQGAAPGTYALHALPFDNGFAVSKDTVLATVVSQGDPVAPRALPSTLLPFEDLTNAQIDQQREISFQVLPSDDPTRANFEISGRLFDPAHVDYELPLNATEEWVVRNPTNVFHPFHIHINPFQVMSVNGVPVPPRSYEDTVSVPPRGEVVLRTRYLDYTGAFVLHCHILPHEDGGMMSLLDVYDPAVGPSIQEDALTQSYLFSCPLLSPARPGASTTN